MIMIQCLYMTAAGKLIGGAGGALDALDGFAGSAADAVLDLINAVRTCPNCCSPAFSHSLC